MVDKAVVMDKVEVVDVLEQVVVRRVVRLGGGRGGRSRGRNLLRRRCVLRRCR